MGTSAETQTADNRKMPFFPLKYRERVGFIPCLGGWFLRTGKHPIRTD
jgi:hypothetical protein